MLAILGLVGNVTAYMVAIATIAPGASLLMESVDLASRITLLEQLAEQRYQTDSGRRDYARSVT